MVLLWNAVVVGSSFIPFSRSGCYYDLDRCHSFWTDGGAAPTAAFFMLHWFAWGRWLSKCGARHTSRDAVFPTHPRIADPANLLWRFESTVRYLALTTTNRYARPWDGALAAKDVLPSQHLIGHEKIIVRAALVAKKQNDKVRVIGKEFMYNTQVTFRKAFGLWHHSTVAHTGSVPCAYEPVVCGNHFLCAKQAL
jgi:hypothetical protein